MKKFSQSAKSVILHIDSALVWLVTIAAICALVLFTIQAAIWVRDEVYVGARMDLPEYVSKVKSGCKKADGCLSATVSFSHLWAADASRFWKLGSHMRVDILALPQAYERSIASVVAQIPETDRQFVRIVYPAGTFKAK